MIINDKDKRHDFYENVQTYGGIDKTIVYNREYREIQIKPKITDLPSFGFYPDKKLWLDSYEHIRTNLIAFCGKLYPIFKYELRDKNDFTKKFFEYSPDFAKFLNFEKRYYKKDLKDLETWFQKNYNITTSCNVVYHSPIVLIRDKGYEVIIDPLLKDVDFYKIMDPFTTFQEIEMFIGSMLCTEKQPKPDNVEDKYKIEQKGFDKFSFRKPKEEKGR